MMKRKFIMIIITVLLICIISVNEAKKKRKKQGPRLSYKQSTSCSEFSKFARFNPYSVLDEIWFVFFYWSVPKGIETYRFFTPSADHTETLHKVFDGNVTIPVNWTARQVIMQNRQNETWLLVERGDRGQYWSYILREVKRYLIVPKDIRLRQHDNGRLLGLMYCESETLYVMSRIREVPLHSKIQDEAARFGFRARRGKSYLYQGHEWMPIPEADENDYFETIFPKIESETNNQGETLHVSDHSVEGRKTCGLKEKLSNSKSVDNSPNSCMQESSELSKETDSKNLKMDRSNSNELKAQINEKTEDADFDNEREAKVEHFNGKSEKDNNNETETETVDEKDKHSSEILTEENDATESVTLENDSVPPGSQLTSEHKQLDLTTEIAEQSSKIQTQLKLHRESDEGNEIREDKFDNVLEVSETAFETKKDEENFPVTQMGLSSINDDKKSTIKHKNPRSTDLEKQKGREDIFDDIPNNWRDFNANNIAYLRPAENTNFIEVASPITKQEIKDPITPSGVLPEKCYKMEMVSETEDFTPSYVPPIFEELYERDTTINTKQTSQEK